MPDETTDPTYSQEDATANALFYVIKAIDQDGASNAEVGRALQAAKDWTAALNPQRFDFANDDPITIDTANQTEQQQSALEPSRVVALPPANNG